jgi:hypothetical protein
MSMADSATQRLARQTVQASRVQAKAGMHDHRASHGLLECLGIAPVVEEADIVLAG